MKRGSIYLIFSFFLTVKGLASSYTILCFGDSNVWGNIPATYNPQTGLCARYERSDRWTGILQNELGHNFYVIEEAINGRTTNLDEIIPGRPFRNGLSFLEFCLESHYPIDIVVFMLGTNDTKPQYQRSSREIGEAIRQLIQTVKTSNKGIEEKSPRILLIAPQPIIAVCGLLASFDETSIKKSEEIADIYRKIALEEGCDFLDASQHVFSSNKDGIHLEKESSKKLGSIIADKLKRML